MINEHCSSCLRRETAPTPQEPAARVGDTGNIGDHSNDKCQLPNEPQSPSTTVSENRKLHGDISLELEGMEATPVDYKRGKAPDIPEGAYEPERVQLCAQGLILRANGFQCDRGVLYFIASKKRVTIEFTAELIQRTRQLRDEFRLTAAVGILPPPLVDSPKCPRCSLVGICLPDETNLLQCGSTLRSEISAEIETARVGDTGNVVSAVERQRPH